MSARQNTVGLRSCYGKRTLLGNGVIELGTFMRRSRPRWQRDLSPLRFADAADVVGCSSARVHAVWRFTELWNFAVQPPIPRGDSDESFRRSRRPDPNHRDADRRDGVGGGGQHLHVVLAALT